MTVAMVGGLDRLKDRYESAARAEGISLKVFSKPRANLVSRISGVDGVIMFTNLISHQAAQQVYKLARSGEVCLICSHNSSLSAAQRCFRQLKGDQG